MGRKKQQVPPLRYAPVGMTILLGNGHNHSEIIDFSTKLSSRPERSAVEGPAVLFPYPRLGAPFKPYFGLSEIPQRSTRPFLSLGGSRAICSSPSRSLLTRSCGFSCGSSYATGGFGSWSQR